MVQDFCEGSEGIANKGFEGKPAQSIIGATLNRRDGPGRLVCGFEADSRGILVYAFPYHFYE